jgi:hypothetical protein
VIQPSQNDLVALLAPLQESSSANSSFLLDQS